MLHKPIAISSGLSVVTRGRGNLFWVAVSPLFNLDDWLYIIQVCREKTMIRIRSPPLPSLISEILRRYLGSRRETGEATCISSERPGLESQP